MPNDDGHTSISHDDDDDGDDDDCNEKVAGTRGLHTVITGCCDCE